MRYKRLIIAEGPDEVDLTLHPSLNVIAGIDETERRSLANELLGALDGTTQGVGLEVQTDDGRHLVVLRGAAGESDQVMDLSITQDVTHEFVGADGRVDLLGALELHKEDLRSVGLLNPHHAELLIKTDPSLMRLSRLDQLQLWNSAEQFRAVKYSDQGVERAFADSPEREALVNEELDMANKRLKDAAEESRRINRISNIASVGIVVAAVLFALMLHFVFLILLAAPLASRFVKARYAQRLEQAREQERDILASAGADSYLGYRLARKSDVNIETHGVVREEQAWNEIAGDVSLEWALELRSKVEPLSKWIKTLSDHGFEPRDDEDPILCGLIMLLAEIGQRSTNSMVLPLILDDGLIKLEPVAKGRALQLLSAVAGSPQIIYLSNDPDIQAWAQSQAVRGADMLLIVPEPDESEA